nr:hypothetical protein [uncultured Brevundimonas sp.]
MRRQTARVASFAQVASIAAVLVAISLIDQATARADDSARDPHGALTVGWLLAVTGPLGVAGAAEAEFFPGGRLGRYGAGIYYRGDISGDEGMITAGLAFEAGASRPKLVMSLHIAAGATYGPVHPALGGGVRAQLGVWGPLVVAGSATSYLVIDGVDSRLALAITLTAGLSR